MLYAVAHDHITLVVAGDDLLDFETFANEFNDQVEHPSYTIERANILDMLGESIYNGYSLAPVKIEGDLGLAAMELKLTLVGPHKGVEAQSDMIERAKLIAEFDQPRDRRTLAEVHDIVDHDPWDNSTEEEKAAAKKQDTHMRSVRDAGGLTGDSFAGSQTDKLNIHRATVHVNADDEITGVDMLATKNSISPYELVVDGPEIDFADIWDELKIPENRIVAVDGNRANILLHDYQTGEIADLLDRRHLTYTLTKQAVDAANEVVFDIDGHDDHSIFYSVQIEQATIHEMIPILGVEGFDISLIATMRNVGRGCWFAFARQVNANECADIFRAAGHACSVVAINRTGQAIVAGGDDSIKVIDTHEHVEIGPRPWNNRAAEIAAMSEEETVEYRKSVQAGEYLIAVEENARHKTLLYITPESYFRDTEEMWEGDIVLDMLPKDHGRDIITMLSPGVYTSKLEAQLLKDNLCRVGCIESMRLRMFLNDRRSEQRAEA